MIYINQVLQYTKDLKRIRVVEIEDSYVFTVDIDAHTSMPKKEFYSTKVTDVEQKELLVIADPFSRVVIDSDLTETQIQKRENDWNAIQTYCLRHMDVLLQKKGREKKIKEIAEGLNVTPTKVKKLLSRYWQQGMTKNAILPDYSNSGGKGKTKALTKEKVGRPRREIINNEYQTGINITDEVKVQIEHVISKYYRKKNNYSLKDVYNFMLRDFYSDRYKKNGELSTVFGMLPEHPHIISSTIGLKSLKTQKRIFSFVKARKNMS